jgi:MFS family permease
VRPLPPTALSRHSFLRRFLPRGALRRDLWVTTADAAAFSVMVGCGETYLPAFALALGFGPVAAGLMASVPILVAALVQLASPYAAARLGSDRAWVIACTTVQAASFVPLVWWAVRGGATLWQVLLAASIYWAAGMAGVSAWNSWMARLVPERMRTAYFAHRNRLGQFGVFFGFVVGGIVLQVGEAWNGTREAFAVLFTLAAASRLLSTLCLAACREPRSPLAAEMQAKPADLPRRTAVLLRGMAARPSGTLVAFVCCFMFGAHVAGPYFTPYMLRELGFSYHAFMLVFATAFLSKALLLPSIGRLASRVGAPRILAMACLAIMPLSLLWLPTGALGWLLCVQVVAGGCWAAYELAVALLFFEAVQDRERTGVLTVYNLGLAVATVAGAGCGGILLRSLGEDRRAYAVLFVVSCLLRLVSLPLLTRFLRQTAAAGR